METDPGNNGTTTMMPPMMMMMQMWFTTDWQNMVVLFQEWKIQNVWQLVVSCIGVALIAVLYEGLRVLREYLMLMSSMGNGRSLHYSETSKEVMLTQSTGGTIRSRMCAPMHWLQTGLHLVQVTTSYFLMLVVMTYSVWLCLSVVVGAAVGYFLFGWKRSVIVDLNEHCH